ncbi:MAG: ATP-binding protein [Proteobacteria bacterium]|nr:ATP-binding protein [Pseudomonadota bacterium]
MLRFFQRFSLTSRVLITSSLALLVGLGIIGLVMDKAFEKKTLHLVEERLDSYLLAILSHVEESDGKLIFPTVLPSPRMEQPGSGMYAQVISDDQHWKTPSLIGQNLPELLALEVNEKDFVVALKFGDQRLFRMRQGFAWDSAQGEIRFTMSVTEHAGNFYRELSEFEETLFKWLFFISISLLGIQWLIMFWATKPLNTLTQDLIKLEKGDELIFSEEYPTELRGLTTSLNRLIENERQNLSRQRKTLGDLAHSLKTPLAVIHSELENEQINKTLLKQQIRNMDEIVAYQLKRAAVAGHRTFVTGIPVIDDLDRIVKTLKKVYREKNIKLHTQVAPGAEFFGERGDLMELLGNLLENAFKWCDANISILIKTLYIAGKKRTGLFIQIGDDGPGIPADKGHELLRRGVRGDEKIKGHGIGLSIVADIVESYQGSIEIETHAVLKGASFKITLPP